MTRLQAFSSGEYQEYGIFPLKGYVESEAMGLHLRPRLGLKFGGLARMGSISKCLIYQFADDVTYHDMTFLYPLSIVRGYNHPVIAQ
jgi:hypothetical protein